MSTVCLESKKLCCFADEGLFVGNDYAETFVSEADPTYVVKELNRYQE